MKHRLFHLLPLARAAATLLLSVSALHAENGLRREVWHGLSAASEESLAKNRAFLGRPLRLTTSPAYYAAPDGADILAESRRHQFRSPAARLPHRPDHGRLPFLGRWRRYRGGLSFHG